MPDDSVHSSSSEGEDDSSTTSSDGDSEPSVDLLVTSRTKRAGAGNRIQKLIEQEEDNELADYFTKNAEDIDSEEDVDFEGDENEALSDAQLDSSSDEEDQGPTKVDDDLEGEKQLQKQERAEKQKKRKAEAGFKTAGALRKKKKLDPSLIGPAQPTTPAPKPKKKSERLSWIPTPDDGPVRASSRKQTMKNKEIIHLRMVEKEKQRVKQMKHMEEAEKKRQAAKAPPMTQAERIAEAARTERKNAKSLNRWEESERKRAEAQKAKLEALHSRQLQGPVITCWSGLTRWVNGKLSEVGIREIREVEADAPPKDGQNSNTHNHSGLSPSDNHKGSTTLPITQVQPSPSIDHSAEPAQPHNSGQPTDVDYEPKPGSGLLDGIHFYASLPSQTKNGVVTESGQAPLSTDRDSSLQHHAHMEPDPIEHPAAFVEKASSPLRLEPVAPKPPQIPPGPIIEYAGRSLVALRNIDSNALNLPELQSSVLVKKRANKLQKPVQELCAITGLPARFRDPKTGLPYADSYAYREIQRLRNGGSKWSGLLGCYVGSTTAAARGVPDRFRRR
ncbi:MAG: hypothetical protein Q9195_004683 [Heterodermia aff. obscurata]